MNDMFLDLFPGNNFTFFKTFYPTSGGTREEYLSYSPRDYMGVLYLIISYIWFLLDGFQINAIKMSPWNLENQNKTHLQHCNSMHSHFKSIVVQHWYPEMPYIKWISCCALHSFMYPFIDLMSDHSSVPFMMSHGLILNDDSNQTLSLMCRWKPYCLIEPQTNAWPGFQKI